jgi:hypothetical protein
MSKKMNEKIRGATVEALRLQRLKSLAVFHVEMMPRKCDAEDDEDSDDEDSDDDESDDEFDAGDLSLQVEMLRRSNDSLLEQCRQLSESKIENELLRKELEAKRIEIVNWKEVRDEYWQQIENLTAQIKIIRQEVLNDDLKSQMAEMEREQCRQLSESKIENERLRKELEEKRIKIVNLEHVRDEYWERIENCAARFKIIRECCDRWGRDLGRKSTERIIADIYSQA